MSSTLTDTSPVGKSKGNYLTILVGNVESRSHVGHIDRILFTLDIYIYIYKKKTSVSVPIKARARRLVSDVYTINLPGDAALSEEQPVLG